MTIAKQGLVLCEMIDRGWVQAVVATGALMTHGFVEGAGMLHFKHRRSMRDEELFQRGYNRVYDTIELEKNLDDTEGLLRAVLNKIEPGSTISSHELLSRVGHMFAENDVGRAILRSAYEKQVPIYVPAFSDSELGLDFAIYNRRLGMQGKQPFAFNPFLDLEDFADRVRQHERLGIFTIGGGVPRNWAQQVAPYLEISADRLGIEEPMRRYPLCGAHLPRARALGRALRLQLYRGRLLGKIRARERRRPPRRSACRRDDRLADHRARRARAARGPCGDRCLTASCARRS